MDKKSGELHPQSWDAEEQVPRSTKPAPDFDNNDTASTSKVDARFWYPVHIVRIKTFHPKSGSGNWCLALCFKIADVDYQETRGYSGHTQWINFALTKGAMFKFNNVLVALGHTKEQTRSAIITRLKKEAIELASQVITGWEGLNETVPVLKEVFLGQPLKVFIDKKTGRYKQEVTDYTAWPEGAFLNCTAPLESDIN